MFLNAEGCNFDKNLREHIGFTGPSGPITEHESINRAMCLFIGFFCKFLTFEINWYLVTLYKSVLAAESDQRINEYRHAVLKRLKFLLKHTHFKHYCDVLFLDQIEYWPWGCIRASESSVFSLD